MKKIIVMAALGFAAAACGGKTTVIPPILIENDDGTPNECRPEGTTRVDPTMPARGQCLPAQEICVDGAWVVQVPAVGPVAETCNGQDDDCDGATDEDFDRVRDPENCGACGRICSFAHASDSCNGGVCEFGLCNAGWFNADGVESNGCETSCLARGPEVCDDEFADEDCDGSVNENCPCLVGEVQACGPAGVSFDLLEDPNVHCKMGFQICEEDPDGPPGAMRFGEDCLGIVYPESERCNDIDDDCDGEVNEGFNVGDPCVGRGICGPGVNQCTPDGRAICSTDRGGTAYAGVPETCDSRDNDCDGVSDNGFPLGIRCFGQGACGLVRGSTECAPDGRDFICSTEPGGSDDQSSPEVCNSLDDDCDGAPDNGIACGCSDGDVQECGVPDAQHGVGICFQGRQICVGGAWQDCFAFRAPDLVERCNGLDDDCDRETDEDIDGRSVGDVCDGAGECPIGAVACRNATETMCSTEPGGRDYRVAGTVGVERCDWLDNDCDGETDELFPLGVVCRGRGACGLGINECRADGSDIQCSSESGGSDDRSSPELCDARFRDEDCDGATNEDCECPNGLERTCGSSNRGECRRGTQTCADGLWGACIGSVEPVVELCNGADDDCDGLVDEDFGVGVICDGVGECPIGVVECWGPNESGCSTDIRGSRYPDYTETCNGLDDDCDGFTDEGYFIGAPCDGTGSCGFGFYECAGPRSIICSTNPGGSDDQSVPESCAVRGIDDDCDGSVDEGCPCTGSEQRACGSSNVGACRFGIQTCVAAPPGVSPDRQWGGCVGNVEPSGETCNGLDDDCDGAVDDGFGIGALCVAPGACGGGRNECNGPAAVRCDVAPGGSRDRSRGELCNGADDDCDGMTDEPFGVGFSCDGVGQCGSGRTECADLDTPRCSTDRGGSGDQSMPESCVGLADESCDGSVNEGCACTYFGPGDPRNNIQCGVSNVGVCRFGTQSCRPDGSYGACVGAVSPSPEVCNGQDDDCDGAADEGLVCGGGGPGCIPVPEVCNGADDDCDGAVDEGGVCMCPAEVCNGLDDDCDGLVDEGSNLCNLRNVNIAACQMAACVIVQCAPNFRDCNNLDPDGCEYGCTPSGPVDICGNGVDDDCDCSVDNNPPGC